jgi:DNA-binding CsgD family transcriptional regulator
LTVSIKVIGRLDEAQATVDFLDCASAEPTALVIEGEPGIGKTTLWLSTLAEARERGFRVLAARPSAAESVLAYAGLADLLSGVDASCFAALPDPQLRAVDRILFRSDDDDAPTDQRAVSAAFLAVVEVLAGTSPVVLAVDDLQWLDPASAAVVAFAARRVLGPVGLLAAVRSDPDSMRTVESLQMVSPDRVRRITIGPLSVGALHAVISERLGRSVSRPAMVRIRDASGGNPFYAIELARALDARAPSTTMGLPNTLAGLVRARLESLDPDAREVLLAAACLATPTVELVARAADSDGHRIIEVLGDAENEGIISIEGNRVMFSHPLLAAGVYTDAAPADRRAMHRRLAGLVDQPELKARHLALSATTADPEILESLEAAAGMAIRRGAPTAAAELLELAIGLGGDTPERRIRLAGMHFDAGDPARAGALLEETVARLAPSVIRAEALHMLAVVRFYQDSAAEAAQLLETALSESADNLELRVRALLMQSFAQLNAAQLDAAGHTIDDAVIHAEMLGQPQMLSQVLGLRTVVRFMSGEGVDEHALRRALELEDPRSTITLPLRPRVENTLLLAWTGYLAQAQDEMLALRRRCLQDGLEGEFIFVAFHTVLIKIWSGDFPGAGAVAEDTIARTLTGTVATYAGQVDRARSDLAEALAAGARYAAHRMGQFTIASVGFLEVSLGNYEAALDILQPLMDILDAMPRATEIISAGFVPDAVEALIHTGRLADAKKYADLIEHNGRRLDRAWMLAVGARGRAMLLAAHGDVAGATAAAQQAMAEHDRVAMPFERARTQLVLGQLHRRQRHKDAASTALREALKGFETLNAPLWAERVRAELARTNVAPTTGDQLTPSEQRVAELTASGMTYREVAAALFISPKTVEVNLSRIYRKLGIHSRAELGRLMGKPNE